MQQRRQTEAGRFEARWESRRAVGHLGQMPRIGHQEEGEKGPLDFATAWLRWHSGDGGRRNGGVGGSGRVTGVSFTAYACARGRRVRRGRGRGDAFKQGGCARGGPGPRMRPSWAGMGVRAEAAGPADEAERRRRLPC